MLHKLMHNANNNFDQLLAGTAIIAIGVSLFLDRNYFFWPPELTREMNDQRLDLFIIILGIGLFILAITDNISKAWQDTLLISCGAVIFMLACTQLLHAFLANQMRMAHTVIGDFMIFALIVRSAYKN